MFHYLFHGIEIRSGISLELPLQRNPENSIPALSSLDIVETDQSPYPLQEPFWTDPYHYTDGQPVARLYRKDGQLVLEAPHTGAFIYASRSIHYYEHGDEPSPVPYLLGRVFALYLELQGFPLLHGCCFTYGNGAAGLLGDSGMGKSTMGAALVAQGLSLLTDDLIPIYIPEDVPEVHPGIPMSRIWPDTGAQFVSNYADAEKIHPRGKKRKVLDNGRGKSRFSKSPQTLKHLFILERNPAATDIQIHTITGASALMELVRMSYRPELVQALGIQPKRMELFALALKSVKVHRLNYPSGFEHVPQVCQKLLSLVKKS